MSDAISWFTRETAGSPGTLAARAREFLAESEAPTVGESLAAAARKALDASIVDKNRREAAVDLLAADALITLALLEVARERPGQLQVEARALWAAALVSA